MRTFRWLGIAIVAMAWVGGLVLAGYTVMYGMQINTTDFTYIGHGIWQPVVQPNFWHPHLSTWLWAGSFALGLAIWGMLSLMVGIIMDPRSQEAGHAASTRPTATS